MRNWFHYRHERDRGNFRAANDELLALFNDPDARGSRSWRETFGIEGAPDQRPDEIPVNVRARPKSSSDS